MSSFLNAWQDAVEACNLLYQCEQKDSIAALGMVADIIDGDAWWFDRDELCAKFD